VFGARQQIIGRAFTCLAIGNLREPVQRTDSFVDSGVRCDCQRDRFSTNTESWTMPANTVRVTMTIRSYTAASDPGTLVALYSTSAANPGWHQTSFKNYADLREALSVEVLAYAPIPVGLSSSGSPAEEVPTEMVSGNYFELLGVRAAVGRMSALTAAADKIAGSHAEIVISDALWKRRFGSRADIVNQVVQLNARPFTIVGVAPPAFVGLDILRAVDIWVPTSNPSILTGVTNFYFGNRSIGMFDIVARTTAATGLRQLGSMLQAQASRLALIFPQDNKGLTLATRPFWQARMNPVQRDTWVRAGGLLTCRRAHLTDRVRKRRQFAAWQVGRAAAGTGRTAGNWRDAATADA
jgi:MacB-like periplasmic core domain